MPTFLFPQKIALRAVRHGKSWAVQSLYACVCIGGINMHPGLLGTSAEIFLDRSAAVAGDAEV
jgi:hypothetical protein